MDDEMLKGNGGGSSWSYSGGSDIRTRRFRKSFYSSLTGIPVAGATLSVIACGFLALYARNPILDSGAKSRII